MQIFNKCAVYVAPATGLEVIPYPAVLSNRVVVNKVLIDAHFHKLSVIVSRIG